MIKQHAYLSGTDIDPNRPIQAWEEHTLFDGVSAVTMETGIPYTFTSWAISIQIQYSLQGTL